MQDKCVYMQFFDNKYINKQKKGNTVKTRRGQCR